MSDWQKVPTTAPVQPQSQKRGFWHRPSRDERLGFWKGFILASIVVGLIAYFYGVNEGAEQMCAQLVEDSGGLMYCESRPPSGSSAVAELGPSLAKPWSGTTIFDEVK